MRFSRLSIGLTLATVLLTVPLAAQSGTEPKTDSSHALSFSLKGEERKSVLPTGLGEFNIQLDSRLPGTTAPLNTNVGSASADVMWSCGSNSALTPVFSDRKLELRRVGTFEPAPTSEPAPTPERPSSEEHRTSFSLGSTLTLSAGYTLDHADWRGPVAQSMAAEGRLGRFTVHGEVGQEKTTALVYPTTARTTTLDATLPRASVRGNQTEMAGTNSDATKSPTATAHPVTLDNYSLEAAYDFSPRFEGKLSYRRSLIDVRDSAENVKLEGSVKTGQNTTIKAGYHNQTRPETTKGQPVNDHKIWTEFLLKF